MNKNVKDLGIRFDINNQPFIAKGCAKGLESALSAKELKRLLIRLEAAEDAVHQAYRCTSANKEYYTKWQKVAWK